MALLRSGRRSQALWYQFEELCTGHASQHASRYRVGPAVVVDVNVKSVHDIEVGIAEQLLHGDVAYCGADVVLHKGLEIRLGSEG